MTLFAFGSSYKDGLWLALSWLFFKAASSLHVVSSGDDHPVLPTIPETEYFRVFYSR
jgi:hypothetical protein